MIVIQKFSRGQFFPPVETGLVFQGRENWAAECGMPIPPTTLLPSYPSTRATRGFRRSKLSSGDERSASRRDWRVGSRRNLDAHASGREGEGAAARSVEDLSSSNTGSSSSSPPRIPSLRLSSQENLHFSLIVLHQRACVIET